MILLDTDHTTHKFKALRKQKRRIGTRDLKIAATALVNDALLLTANRTMPSSSPPIAPISNASPAF